MTPRMDFGLMPRNWYVPLPIYSVGDGLVLSCFRVRNCRLALPELMVNTSQYSAMMSINHFITKDLRRPILYVADTDNFF